MKRVAIVQARTSSSRLPGKVIEPILGIPMIVFMLRRVARAQNLDHLVLATSVEESDDVLSQIAAQYGFDCYRGDLLDVLGRFVGAAKLYEADVIVRLTGDCPLIDFDVIDSCVATLVQQDLDYVSNVDPPTFPDGLDVEVLTIDALAQADAEAKTSSDREHVTPYIRRNKTKFRQANVHSCVDLSSLRWTVDHPDDLELVRALVNSVQHRGVYADRFDFLRALDLDKADMPKNYHGRCERYDEKTGEPRQPNPVSDS
jgi:spore coat polysaccharide biosynthesis protein SpsF (cytidylyltransferase family)